MPFAFVFHMTLCSVRISDRKIIGKEEEKVEKKPTKSTTVCQFYGLCA